jgi:hypothetical protein
MPRPTSPARCTSLHAPPSAAYSYPDCPECAGLGFDVYRGRCRADAGPCLECLGRGYVRVVRAAVATVVPPAPWATDAELVGGAPRALAYPAPSAAMAAVETWRPAAGGAA